MIYLQILNGMCSGILFSRWHNSLNLKKISCFAGKSYVRNCVQTDNLRFSLYLGNMMRYLKSLNGICSGIVFSRWHNLTTKKNGQILKCRQNTRFLTVLNCLRLEKTGRNVGWRWWRDVRMNIENNSFSIIPLLLKVIALETSRWLVGWFYQRPRTNYSLL